MKRKASARSEAKSAGKHLLLGLLVSLCATTAAVLLFALTLQLFNLSEDWITAVNQIIKAGSILLGCVYACRAPLPNYRCGLLLGGTYMALGVGLYCLLDQRPLPFTVILGDLALGLAVGFLSGLLISSFRREKTA